MTGAIPAWVLTVLGQSFDGIGLVATCPWRVVYANPTLASLLQIDQDGDATHPTEGFVGVRSAELLAALDRFATAGQEAATLAIELRTEDNTTTAAQLRLCRVDFGSQPLVAIIIRPAPIDWSLADVPAERRDPLTGLADRSFVMTRLTELLAGQRSADHQFAVMFIDLDNFKQVNDSHGHLVGDRVLQEVAARLIGCVRTGDHIARFGGDEFVVILEGTVSGDEIQPVIDRIHAALETPIALTEGEARLSVSVGVAQAADWHRSAEDLLIDADRDMYARKRVNA